jgi:hypothetical protein
MPGTREIQRPSANYVSPNLFVDAFSNRDEPASGGGIDVDSKISIHSGLNRLDSLMPASIIMNI